MTILELITAQCGVQGVDKKYAARIEKIFGITEEKDGNIIAAVKNFKENVLPSIQEAENSGKKSVEEYEKKHGLKDGKPVETKKDDEPGKVEIPDNLDPSVKAMIEAQNKSIETLTGLVSGMVKSQKNVSVLETVKSKLKGKIDDKFIEKVAAKVNLDAEDIDAEIEAQVSEFNELRQSIIDEHVGENYIPSGGKSAGDRSVEDWKKLMDTSDTADTGVVDLGLGK
ncbi:hypothetical protein [Proteiniphilum acetatigenes]|uniref:hypothetical protein n=1 Tax=Proteiniphilum acetatigenes TaxID=294710 RepID=UPI0003801A92|nr:hypothetical protein [Proteiniphilum acetatigenes]